MIKVKHSEQLKIEPALLTIPQVCEYLNIKRSRVSQVMPESVPDEQETTNSENFRIWEERVEKLEEKLEANSK